MYTACNKERSEYLPAIKVIRPRGYKTFSMLKSVEHAILNAHKYKNIEKLSIFQAQISLEC